MATEESQDMTTRYTQAEWGAIITEAEKDIPSSFPEYKAPILGSPNFAQCIDHTLLKLDANKDQVDELCEEARRHNFRVRSQFSCCHDGVKHSLQWLLYLPCSWDFATYTLFESPHTKD